jgi:predicted transcriptional regulator
MPLVTTVPRRDQFDVIEMRRISTGLQTVRQKQNILYSNIDHSSLVGEISIKLKTAILQVHSLRTTYQQTQGDETDHPEVS